MRLRSTIISGLLFLLVHQSPQDTIRQHYQSAEAARQAGNLEAAESEYAAILGEGYQRLGRLYSARSDYQLAVTVLEVAQKYRPNSPEVLVDLGIAYFSAKQYERALVPASKALAIAPDNAGARQMLGKTYFMLGDLGRSIHELETAAKLAPDDIDVAYTLGIAYLRNRQPAAAQQLYYSLIRRFGEKPQLHVIIGRAYRQSGLLLEAAEEFKKAIALDSRFPRAHYYLGITYLLDEGQSKISEALEQFKIEVAANPDEFFANYYLGVVYNFQRQWDLAVTSLQKASTIQPHNPDPYFQLGQAYQELNNHQQAIEVLRKAIALNPDLAHNKSQVTTAHHRLAQSLLKTGQTEAGQRELQIAADLKAQAFKLEQQTHAGEPGMGKNRTPDAGKELLELASGNHVSPSAIELDESAKRELQRTEAYFKKVIGTAHNNVGLLRGERLDFPAAAEQFSQAAKWDPQQEGLDYNLGLAYYKSESYKQAAPPLENELKLHPGNRRAAMLLGLTLFRLGNYARSAELLNGVIDPQSTDINIYYALASALIKLRKAEAADRVIGQITRIKADAPQLHLLLAEEYEASGARAKALAKLSEVAASNSNALLVHYNAGLLYLKLGKRDEALREFVRELTLNPNDTQAKYSLGDLFLAGKDIERGLALIREVIQARPEHAEARYALGKTLLQRGDVTGAINNLERASKLEPASPEIHNHLGQAYLAAGRKSEGKSHIEMSKQLRSRKSENQE
ncbi:MAG TPA: tetratricopeptide repeat protein [Pyrinomonadaceae bacterium]|nr:tetratricopeptide repeat protein [Pyrinomonadaceae bacterium]